MAGMDDKRERDLEKVRGKVRAMPPLNDDQRRIIGRAFGTVPADGDQDPTPADDADGDDAERADGGHDDERPADPA